MIDGYAGVEAQLMRSGGSGTSDNNRPRREARFAVGSRDGPRSTIWKVWTHGDEVYIASRMFGSDMKVSFHSTGECQCSATDSYVKRHPGMLNKDRHLTRWTIERPVAEHVLIFQVDIPISELRSQPPPTDRKKVFWFSGAPHDVTVRFHFYLTPAGLPLDPATTGRHPPLLRHVFSLRLRNRRWVVVFVQAITLIEQQLRDARTELQARALAAGITPNEHHRAGLVFSPTTGSHRGILELCLVGV